MRNVPGIASIASLTYLFKLHKKVMVLARVHNPEVRSTLISAGWSYHGPSEVCASEWKRMIVICLEREELAAFHVF